MRNLFLNVAGHSVLLEGDVLVHAVERQVGFEKFLSQECMGEQVGIFSLGDGVPAFQKENYTIDLGSHAYRSGIYSGGFILEGTLADRRRLTCWKADEDTTVYFSGELDSYFFRFALWLGYGLLTYRLDTLAIHTSCIVWQNQAVVFLGESGTGKSTHTRLWMEHVPGAFLLNDDSPILRVIDGKVYLYGSPWSGKTPCYRTERYPLKGCVRLRQAPANHIERLKGLKAYAALHPSCSPDLACNARIYDEMSRTLERVVSLVPVYWLACLPDAAAVNLSSQTLFTE